jgi:hypothetical protein
MCLSVSLARARLVAFVRERARRDRPPVTG